MRSPPVSDPYSQAPAARSIFDRYRVERAPQVPRRDAAIGRPARAELAELGHGHALAVAVVQRDGLLQADVVDGKHVRAKLVEDEEHLRGPAADALHVDQALDERLVVERRPLARVER